MATERHNVVIGVEFLGERDVNRFTSAMQRAQAAAASASTQVQFLTSGQSGAQIGRSFEAAAQSALDFDNRTQQAIASTARMTREVQGLQQALRSLQSTAGQPLALPAGGSRPRTTDYDLPGPSRFISRDRALELGQQQFLTALRERTRGESVAAVTAKRLADAQERQIRETERAIARATVVEYTLGELQKQGAVLNTQGAQVLPTTVGGTDLPRAIASTAERMDRAAQNLNDATRQFQPSARAINSAAFALNQAILQERASRYRVDDSTMGLSPVAASELHRLAFATTAPQVAGDKALQDLFYRGTASGALLRGLAPETREALTGGQVGAQDSMRGFPGVDVGGLYGRDAARQHLFEEQFGSLDRQFAQAQSAHQAAQGALALPVGPQGQAQQVQQAQAQQFILTRQQAIAATRRAAEEEQKLAQSTAALSNTQRTQQAQQQRITAGQAAAQAAAGGGAGPGSGGITGGGGGGGTPPPPPPGAAPPPGSPGGRPLKWWEIEDQKIAAAQGQAGIAPSEALRARQVAAEAALDRVMLKGDEALGSKKGYADEDARAQAYAAAQQRVISAYRALHAAIEKETAASNAAATRTAPVNMGVPYGPSVSPAMAQAGFAQAQAAAQAAGVLGPQASPQAQAVQAAQQNLAQATAAHAAVQKQQYQSGQAAGQAYLASLGQLTQAQNQLRQAQAAQSVQNNIAATQRAGWMGGGGGPGGYGGTPPGGGFGSFGAGRTPGGGFANDFAVGFHGRSDRSYAEQLGQTMKFSLMYGTAYKLLFAVTQTMQAALQETIAFEQAMTELAIATGRPKEELDGLADAVGAASVAAGFAPSQGIEIAARSQGLYGVTSADPATQDAVGRISAQVVSRLAVGSKKDPVTLQGDIAAIVQALGMDATGQQRIADLDAYMSKKFGIQQGATLETVAQSASVGKAAGFTNEELFAIAADMQSRTGQTPSAVAGFMAQIFSRGGEGSLVDVAKREGIDPTQELQGIIRELALVYKEASPQKQAEISAAFGRGKIQNAAVALLGDYDEVLAQSEAAAAGAAQGVADRTFSERMNNLGGEIAVLAGLFKQMASELGQSGLLDIVGAGVLLLQQFLEAVNAILDAWNELPNVTQDVVLAMGALLLAMKSETVQRALSNRSLALQGVTGAGPGGIPLAMQGPGARAGAALSASMAALVNPITLAIGGLLAIGSIRESANKMDEAFLAASQTLAAGAGMQSADDFRNQAALLGTTATQNRDATGGFLNFISFGMADNQNQLMATRLDAEARRLINVANDMEAEERARIQPGGGVLGSHLVPLMGGPGANYRSAVSSVFESFAPTDVTEGLKEISDAGGSAATQFDSLSAAIFNTADSANQAALAVEKFNQEQFAQRNAAGLVGTASQGINEFLGRVDSDTGKLVPGSFSEKLRNPLGTFMNIAAGTTALGLGQLPTSALALDKVQNFVEDDATTLEQQRAKVNNQLGAFLNGEEVVSRLREGVDKLKITSTGEIGDKAEKLAEIVGAGAAEAALKGSGASPEDVEKLQRRINRSLTRYLRQQGKELRDLSVGRLTRDEGASYSTELLNTGQAAIDLKSETDFAGRSRRARAVLASVQQTVRRAPTSPTLRVNLRAAQELVAENEFAELENLRKTAQQNATSKRQIQAIGRRFINRAIQSAVANRSGDVLAQILGAAGKGAIEIARQAIDSAVKTAQAAIDVAVAIMREAEVMGPYVAGYITKRMDALNQLGLPVPQSLRDAAKALRQGQTAQRDIKGLQAMRGPHQYDPEATMDKGLDSGNPKLDKWYGEDADKAEKDKETLAEINAARAEAFATRSGSAVAAARAHILSARAAIAKAKGKGVEYWNAMSDLFAGQNELAEALASRGSARTQAYAARSGGAVDAAKANVASARATLSTIKNRDAEYWEAMGSLWSAQNELADAMLAHQKNQMLLSIDMTNPLAVARVDTRAAALKLREDVRTGAGADVIAQDKVDLRSARANEESTRFSQRLSAVQTAEELGRISHSKYINYLENEHDRLNKIKDRTFQQQDQLDQIDRLLMDASKSMDAQFNLGDIKLPTPYQVRRYIAEASGTKVAAMARAGNATSSNVQINVNGADTAKVTQIIEKHVGRSSRTRTVAPRRR